MVPEWHIRKWWCRVHLSKLNKWCTCTPARAKNAKYFYHKWQLVRQAASEIVISSMTSREHRHHLQCDVSTSSTPKGQPVYTKFILHLDKSKRGADRSLAQPNWKNNWKVTIFRPTRRSLLPRRPGWTDELLNFSLNGLQKLEFGRCSLFPSWSC